MGVAVIIRCDISQVEAALSGLVCVMTLQAVQILRMKLLFALEFAYETF